MAGYVSKLNPGEIVIDDDNFGHFIGNPVIDGEMKSRGLIPRDWEKEPFCSQPFMSAFPSELLIPREELDDWIAEMEGNKSRISDLLDQAGLGVLDQNGTNYCWGNGPVHCVEAGRVIQGEQFVRLSPASVCAPIKGYRNVGGWGTEALRYIVEHGIVPQSEWPANAIDRKYDNAETRELRKKFKVQEWFDLRPRSEMELLSCLCRRIPVAVGYNWWGHEVTAIDPVALGNGKYGIRIDNSWGKGWQSNGRGILSGTKHLPDDAVAPRMTTPSFL